MTKSEKRAIRRKWRREVLQRDDYTCIICHSLGECRETGESSNFDNATTTQISIMQRRGLVKLDAHHIVDRNEAEDGGYTLDNGATLCSNCHIKAEQKLPGFTEEDIKEYLRGYYMW